MFRSRMTNKRGWAEVMAYIAREDEAKRKEKAEENVAAWFDADDALVKLAGGNASEHEKAELRQLGYNIPE
jgi:hypothetical protein